MFFPHILATSQQNVTTACYQSGRHQDGPICNYQSSVYKVVMICLVQDLRTRENISWPYCNRGFCAKSHSNCFTLFIEGSNHGDTNARSSTCVVKLYLNSEPVYMSRGICSSFLSPLIHASEKGHQGCVFPRPASGDSHHRIGSSLLQYQFSEAAIKRLTEVRHACLCLNVTVNHIFHSTDGLFTHLC